MTKEKATQTEAQAAPKTLNPKDTSSANARAMIIQALRTGPKTTIELREHHHVMAPAPRVLELRERGYSIYTYRVKAKSADGVSHNGVARYALLKEPQGDSSRRLTV